MRRRVMERLVDKTIEIISNKGLTEEELVIFLGQILIRVGYSMHFNGKENIPREIHKESAEEIALMSPTAGSSIMKLGFDIQDVLIER